jgi:hypothetical protein
MELSAVDRDALKRSAADLSDICLFQRSRIEAGFRAAYQRAEQIRLGTRSPLS